MSRGGPVRWKNRRGIDEGKVEERKERTEKRKEEDRETEETRGSQQHLKLLHFTAKSIPGISD